MQVTIENFWARRGRDAGETELSQILTEELLRRGIFVKGLVTSQRSIVPLGMDTIGEKSGYRRTRGARPANVQKTGNKLL